MRICPKCRYVYGSCLDNYCQFDGNMLVDTANKKINNIIEKIRTGKLKGGYS